MNEPEQLNFIYELFDPSLPRLGPGDAASTTRALRTILANRKQREDPSPSTQLRILDLGSGNGAQTMQLAKHTRGTILALERFQSTCSVYPA